MLDARMEAGGGEIDMHLGPARPAEPEDVLPGTPGPRRRPLGEWAAGEGSDREAAEAELIARCRRGDQAAFADLLDRFQPRVFRLLDRMAPWPIETVEDLVQEVFLRVHRGLPAFEGKAGLGTWIHRIAVNVGLSALRARKAEKRARRTLSLDAGRDDDEGLRARLEPAAPGGGPAEEAARREDCARLRAAIQALPPLWNLVLTLRDLEGHSYEEIAEILGVPVGTVRSRLHRARLRVRRLLEGDA